MNPMAGVREVVSCLEAEAEAQPELWPDMAAVLVQLASQQEDTALQLDLRHQLANVCEKQLGNLPRAFLALQTSLLMGDQVALYSELTRLAHATKRFEDLLALLDQLTTPEFKLEQRKKVVRQRASICLWS